MEYSDGKGRVQTLSSSEKHELLMDFFSGSFDVYGFGAVNYEMAYNWQFPFPYKAIFDNLPEKQGRKWNGRQVLGPENLKKLSPDQCLIVILPIAPARSVESIRHQITSYGPFRTVTWASLLEWSCNQENSLDWEIDEKAFLSLICDKPQQASLAKCKSLYEHLKMSGPLFYEALCANIIQRNQRPNSQICILTDCLALGGAERQMVSLATEIKKSGKEIDFCVYNDENEEGKHYQKILVEHGVEPNLLFKEFIINPSCVIENIMSWDDDNLKLITWLLPVLMVQPFILSYNYFYKTQPALAIAYLDLPTFVCAMAALLAGVPHIGLSGRNYTPDYFPHFFTKTTVEQFQRGMRFFASYEQVIIYGNSNIASQTYAQWIGLAEEEVPTIPNGISPSFVKRLNSADAEKIREDYHISKNAPLILGVFRLAEEKNPLAFVDVFQILIKDYPDLIAVICGVGPMKQTIENYAIKQGIAEDKIKLVGASDDVATWMKSADLLLHPSNYEGMPNVILEAQAAGLPVVSTDVGGVKSCLAEELLSYMSIRGDQDSLTQSCQKLLKDKWKRTWMIPVSQQVLERFSAQRMAATTLELFGMNLNEKLQHDFAKSQNLD